MPAVENRFFSDTPELAGCPAANKRHLISEQLIGTSRWAKEAREAVVAHAAHDHPILIKGEPGAGKELVARLIHEGSARCQGPFVAVSCASIAEESLEAALFGWIRELPSGRNRVQRGLVEAAQGGTLYITGVTTLSDLLKTKIARLIQHQEFRRLGDQVLEGVDVRVILGATELSGGQQEVPVLKSLTVAGVLTIPPLRRRKADIEPLSRHFIQQFCRRNGREPRETAPDTLDALRRYDWPGNVEELKQVVEEMAQKSRPPCLDPSLVPTHLVESSGFNTYSIPESGINLSEEMKRFERLLLCEALKQSRGKQIKAAQLLGLKPTTLNSKLMRYEIDGTAFR